MGMEISKSFVVRAPAAAVWDFLTDPAGVARCLPGAAVTHQVDDRTHAGTITVKVGPVAATYNGTMRFERLDPAARTVEIVATGRDVRGRGSAEMHMSSTLVERAPGETEVAIRSQVDVMGMLAQFGSRMIQDVSDQLFDTFVAAVRSQLEKPIQAGIEPAAAHEPAVLSGVLEPRRETPGATPPIEVLSLGSAVIGRAAARALAKPAVWAGAVLLILIIYWVWRG